MSIITLVKVTYPAFTCTSQQNTIWYDSCLDILPARSAPVLPWNLNVTLFEPTRNGYLRSLDFKLLDFSDTDGDFEVSDEDINIGISVQKGNTGFWMPEQRTG